MPEDTTRRQRKELYNFILSRMPLEDILKENDTLIQRIRTMNIENIRHDMWEFKRYKVLQAELKRRGVLEFNKLTFTKKGITRCRKRLNKLLGDKCEDCGTAHNLTIHHIISPFDGGKDSDNIENFKLLCRSCHDKIHGYRVVRIRGKLVMQFLPGVCVEA